MKTLRKEQMLCPSCLEEHQVQIVETDERETFKDTEVRFKAVYQYCENTDEFLENEDMIRANSLAIKDAYRNQAGLLTSAQIRAIREKYGISQKEFAGILDWSPATITRYENHQVQDRAHDDILRKIDADPHWFLEILNRAKAGLTEKQFKNYRYRASELYKEKKNQYLIDCIMALYAGFDQGTYNGGTELNLNKVVEIINYLAMTVENLHKVKLMKMLWYADILHYKRYGKSITGLVYSALPMGAVPEGYEHIVLLDGVSFDIVRYGEDIGYKFKPVEGFRIEQLTDDEIRTINDVIGALGSLSTNDIVARMHEEDAYKCTSHNCIIDYSFAEKLSLE